MKRILCILSSLSAGGAETFLMKIYRALPPGSYQLDFIVSEDNGCYTEEVLNRGGRIFVIPKRTENFWSAMKGIANTVHKNEYDCVLKLGNPPVAGLDLIAARIGGAKKLAMRSCNALTGLSKKEKTINAILRPVLNLAANVKLAPSMLAAEFTFGKYHAHRDVHLIHNGVDLDIFRFDYEHRRNIREEFSLQDKLVVGHIGRFHKQKNHRFLLDVFQEIHNQQPNAVLLLVGTGELEDQLRKQVNALSLDNSVIFTGQRFDIPQLLSAMDVFVFPSFHEGMPNTVIEAQATGLPCVIADTITKEANITGLVQYLSLEQPPEIWADMALSVLAEERVDTSSSFLAQGYDINDVAQDFLKILGC